MWLGYEVGRLLKFQFIINDWEKRKKLSKSLVSARIQTINPQISLPYCENVTSINWKVSGNHHMGSSMAKEWTWSWFERNWATTATFFGSEHATEMRLLWERGLKEERRGWVGLLRGFLSTDKVESCFLTHIATELWPLPHLVPLGLAVLQFHPLPTPKPLRVCHHFNTPPTGKLVLQLLDVWHIFLHGMMWHDSTGKWAVDTNGRDVPLYQPNPSTLVNDHLKL